MMTILESVILLIYSCILIFIKHFIFFIVTSFLKHLFFCALIFLDAVSNKCFNDCSLDQFCIYQDATNEILAFDLWFKWSYKWHSWACYRWLSCNNYEKWSEKIYKLFWECWSILWRSDVISQLQISIAVFTLKNCLIIAIKYKEIVWLSSSFKLIKLTMMNTYEIKW